MRGKSRVFYSQSDIVPIGEFNGRLDANGVVVRMKADNGKVLTWNTTINPHKYNNVERYTDTSIIISYDVVSEDVSGHIVVKNVRFLKGSIQSDK